MSEEIKETLDRTLEYLEGIDKTRGTKILTTNETNILLDYVNNLQQKVEQLENTRKEAIEYVYKHIQEYDADGTFANLDEFDFIARPQVLLNILNRGDNKYE